MVGLLITFDRSGVSEGGLLFFSGLLHTKNNPRDKCARAVFFLG